MCAFEVSKYPTMKAETDRKKTTQCGPVKEEKKSRKGAYAEGKA